MHLVQSFYHTRQGMGKSSPSVRSISPCFDQELGGQLSASTCCDTRDFGNFLGNSSTWRCILIRFLRLGSYLSQSSTESRCCFWAAGWSSTSSRLCTTSLPGIHCTVSPVQSSRQRHVSPNSTGMSSSSGDIRARSRPCTPSMGLWFAFRPMRFTAPTSISATRSSPLAPASVTSLPTKSTALCKPYPSSSRLETALELKYHHRLDVAEFGTIDHDLHRARRAPVAKFFSRTNVAQLEGEIKDYVQMLCNKLLRESGKGPVELKAAYSKLPPISSSSGSLLFLASSDRIRATLCGYHRQTNQTPQAVSPRMSSRRTLSVTASAS